MNKPVKSEPLRRIKLPPEVADIYKAVEGLNSRYARHERKFTPDGHLVGSIGEVIAAEEFGLSLLPPSHAGHDAKDQDGRLVQIKLTAGRRVSMYGSADRLIVMRVVDATSAELIYDGPGQRAWDGAGKMQKNGQRSISVEKLMEPGADDPRAPAVRS
jgi:hypothetical protein